MCDFYHLNTLKYICSYANSLKIDPVTDEVAHATGSLNLSWGKDLRGPRKPIALTAMLNDACRSQIPILSKFPRGPNVSNKMSDGRVCIKNQCTFRLTFNFQPIPSENEFYSKFDLPSSILIPTFGPHWNCLKIGILDLQHHSALQCNWFL